MGIPHRRGYLLYGPPGCGKTSFCQALAGALQLDLCLLLLSGHKTTDSQLAALFRNAPPRSILILEDVDAVFTKREKQNDSLQSSITFSGLLNAIDGVLSQEGRLMIMTTNHIENLDPALIRPGRCDVKIMVRNASAQQLVAMFLRFFPGQDENARRFASSVPEDILSLARVQGHLMRYRHSAEEAIETAHQLVNQP